MNSKYKCSEEMFMRCEQNFLCNLCDGKSLYKNVKEEKAEKRERNQAIKKNEQSVLKTFSKEKKEGMGFEKKVAKQWNNSFSNNSNKKKVGKPRLSFDDEVVEEKPEPSSSRHKPKINKAPIFKKPEAQRQVNSGAMWYSKGDIKLEHALMECKERGTVNSKGAKTISIPLDWIEKQELEAFQENRPFWYIPFGYKGHDEVYLVKSYQHEIEMVQEIRNKDKRIAELESLLKEKGGE